MTEESAPRLFRKRSREREDSMGLAVRIAVGTTTPQQETKVYPEVKPRQISWDLDRNETRPISPKKPREPWPEPEPIPPNAEPVCTFMVAADRCWLLFWRYCDVDVQCGLHAATLQVGDIVQYESSDLSAEDKVYMGGPIMRRIRSIVLIPDKNSIGKFYDQRDIDPTYFCKDMSDKDIRQHGLTLLELE